MLARLGAASEGTVVEAPDGARVCESIIYTSALPHSRAISSSAACALGNLKRYSPLGSARRIDPIGDIYFDYILFDADAVRKQPLKTIIARNELIVPPPFRPLERMDPCVSSGRVTHRAGVRSGAAPPLSLFRPHEARQHRVSCQGPGCLSYRARTSRTCGPPPSHRQRWPTAAHLPKSPADAKIPSYWGVRRSGTPPLERQRSN